MTEIINNYIAELYTLFTAMSPYLLLGLFFAGILRAWFPQRWITKYMGQNNFKSVINAAILGIPLPLCSCGVIPTGVSFYKNGASKGASVSFFISTPQTGIDSILVTYSLLGIPFAIIRVIVALVTGLIGGLITNLLEKKPEIESEFTTTKNNNKTKKHISFKKSLYILFKYGFHDFLMDIAKWLLIGIAIAALLSVILPNDFFERYINTPFLSMLLVLVASVPLYLCATGSVPIAAVLMLKGLSPGAALILLMAGPATNAATITVMKKVFGTKTLVSYLSTIIFGAFAFGTIINIALPQEWFNVNQIINKHHTMELPEWIKIASAVILLLLIAIGYIYKYRKNTINSCSLENNSTENNKNTIDNNFKNNIMEYSSLENNNYQHVTYTVEGMMCNHCKNNVETNVGKLENIERIVANQDANTVDIWGKDIDDEIIKEQINGLGYKFIGKKL